MKLEEIKKINEEMKPLVKRMVITKKGLEWKPVKEAKENGRN